MSVKIECAVIRSQLQDGEFRTGMCPISCGLLKTLGGLHASDYFIEVIVPWNTILCLYWFGSIHVFVGVSCVGRVAIECRCSVHSCGSRYLNAGVIFTTMKGVADFIYINN